MSSAQKKLAALARLKKERALIRLRQSLRAKRLAEERRGSLRGLQSECRDERERLDELRLGLGSVALMVHASRWSETVLCRELELEARLDQAEQAVCSEAQAMRRAGLEFGQALALAQRLRSSTCRRR